MNNKHIQIHLPSIEPRQNEPVKFGVAFACGELQKTDQLQLLSSEECIIPFTSEVSARWPDGSLRWVLFHAQLPFLSVDTSLLLTEAISVQASQETHTYSKQKNALLLESQAYFHQFDLEKACLFSREKTAPEQDAWQITFHLKNQQIQPIPLNITHADWLSSPSSLYAELQISGYYLLPQKLHFSCKITFYPDGLIALEPQLHNPARARHNGGLWDLGDDSSIQLTEFSIQIRHADLQQIQLQTEPASGYTTFKPEQEFKLYQASSGGENWNCLNHIDANGKLTLEYKGYQLSSANHLLHSGTRAQPLAHLHSQNAVCHVAIAEFWQQFPSAMSMADTLFSASIFPLSDNKTYELQGGERKTQRVYLSLSNNKSALNWVAAPSCAALQAYHFVEATAFPWFNLPDASDPVLPLLAPSLEGPCNFFSKREIIDEYGWRNYGDIFADHETLYQAAEDTPFISHYNNQYDAIYGFARQFAMTGDARWYQLMDELARHVTDIDIYHTEADRTEYNNGLFWHTDHYLPAHTATHRTFSRHNLTSSTPGQTGGGPAAEHCYTTGLAFHYFMTGQSASKEAVVQLAGWMIALHQGSKGLLSKLWSAKSVELPKLKKLLKGQPCFPYQYPFTRGTGNYITSLLDAFEVTADHYYLKHCEQIISDTLHPADNIEMRNLLNVEACWSYLILLGSIARYLQLKARLEQYDDAFAYARSAFLAYCGWMEQHERLFLSMPEQLEYPNDTWLAQDIRKAMLMFQAAELAIDEQQRQHFVNRGKQWLNEICEQLGQSTTLHFARIQIILLQNYGPHKGRQHYSTEHLKQLRQHHGSAPAATVPQQLLRLCKKAAHGLIELRPTRERHWLKTRIES